MPKGTAFDITALATWSKEKVKKEGETGSTVITPGTGKRFRIVGLSLTASEVDSFALTDGSTTFFNFEIPKKPAFTTIMFPLQGYLSTKEGNKLVVTGGSAEREVTGVFWGIEDVA